MIMKMSALKAAALRKKKRTNTIFRLSSMKRTAAIKVLITNA